MADPKKALEELKKKYGTAASKTETNISPTNANKQTTTPISTSKQPTATTTTKRDPKKALEELKKKYTGTSRNAGGYYSPPEAFTSEDEYNTWRSSIRSSFDDIEKDIKAIKNDKDYQYWAERAEAYKLNADVFSGQAQNGIDVEENTNLANEFTKLYEEAAAKLEEYNKKKALYEEELGWSKYFKYSPAELSKNADWSDLSQYKSTATGKEPEYIWSTGTYLNSIGYDDITYDYINRNEDAISYQEANDARLGFSFSGTDDRYLKQMTDDEIAVFNYLYALDEQSGDKEHKNAYDYIKYITGDLNYRQRKEEQEYWTQYANESPVLSSAFSVVTSPLRGLSYIGQIADRLDDGEIDQNAGYNKFSYIPSDIRNEVSRIADEKWGGVGSFLYQTGMSMGDFLMSTAVSGGNSALSLAIMGTSSAADTTIDALNRGLSSDQALALGAVSGLAEVVTEKVSLDALLGKTKWSKTAIGYLVSNTVAEGSEEMASELITTFADVLISEDKSYWQMAVNAYMSQGYSESEAFSKAMRDKALEVGLAGLGGALSGGVIGSVGAAGMGISNAINNAKSTSSTDLTAPTVTDTPTAETDPLLSAALEAVQNEAEAAEGNDTLIAPNITQTVTEEATREAEQNEAPASELGVEERATQAAYKAGRQNVPIENLSLETEAQEDAYIAGKREAILSNDFQQTVEKTEAEVYTGGEKTAPTAESAERLTPSQAQAANVMVSNVVNEARRNGVSLSEFYNATENLNIFSMSKADVSTLVSALRPVVEAIGNDTNIGYLEKLSSYAGAALKKEDVINGTEIVGEVSDGETIQRSGSGRQNVDGLLDGMAPENVREDAPRGDVDPDAAAESGGTSGLARGYAASGDDGVRSAGVHQGGSVLSSAGERSGESVQQKTHGPLNTVEELDRAISTGSGFVNGRKRIYDYYQKKPSPAAAIEFLKKEYGIGGQSWELLDGTRAHLSHDAKGLTLEVFGGDKHTFTWKEVDKRLRALISEGKYYETGSKDAASVGERSETDDAAARYEEKERKKREVMEKYGLTEDEAWAVTEYKTAEAYKVNAKLRDNDELNAFHKKLVEQLDSALKKLPKRKGTLYRTVSFDDVFDPQGEYNAFLAQHQAGAPVGYAAFTSTSAKADGHPLAENTQYGVTLEIVGENGRDLEGFGNNFESEVLFERNTLFFVSEVGTGSDGRPYIKMVEVSESGKSQGRVPVHTEERGVAVRDVQEAQGVHSDVRSVQGQNSEGNSVGQNDLQGESGSEVTAEIEQKSELATQEEPKGVNFLIGEKGQKMPTTPKARYKANADAIKTLRTIMAEGRMATPQEQDVLSKYTGWGGLSDVFDENKTDWAKEYKQLKNLLDDGEYKTAKGSILDAYYTEPTIIRGMYNGLAKLGFTGGRLLEPSAGVGRFIGAMPQEMLQGVNSWTAVELDKITGNIAKYLYPNADVRVQGYETTKIPDNYMDVVIGNVPFGNIPIADKAYPAAVTKSIHNYFIAKSLDKLRPGGVMAVITSSGTMDSHGDSARSYFMKQADLIGAIRLPNTAFEGTGTNVVSDILIFKKRESGTAYKGEAFADVGRKSWDDPDMWGSYELNEYFVNHPEMVLGKPAYSKGQYGRTVVTYNPLDSKLSLQKQIEKAFSRIDAKMDYPVQRTQEEIRKEIKEAAGKVKEGGIVKRDGKLYQNVGGQMVEAKDIFKADTERMGDIVDIRDAARALLDMQLDDAGDKAISSQRKKLNDLYDAFVKKHGTLNSNKNRKLVRADAADSSFILALEDYNKDAKTAKKAAIFNKNTIKPIQTITHADTVDEALTVVMNETGTVDVQRIAELTGQKPAAVEREMLERGLVFKNRTGALETAEVYLSGNVRAKLRDAEALAEGNEEYKRNVEALKKVIPADIPAEEIKVRLGATWIPDSVYSAFAGDMLGGAGMTWKSGQRVPAVEVTYNRLVGKFFVEINDAWLRHRAQNTTDWGTDDYPFVGSRNSILDAALNNKTVAVWRTLGDDTRVLDKQATAAAQEKLEKVLAEFQSWLWKDEARRTELGGLYNDVFNNTVTPKYDGSNLTVNGSNPEMEMRPHQKNAVQRIINSGGNTLLAHRVGAGKTYEMAAAAMKLRQLGVVKKPLFVVPKHLVSQWGNEFLSYFPAAKVQVLEAKDFTPANRKIYANRIATGDYDAVVMSYEQFGMLPMSTEHQEAFYQEQIDALEMAILESKRAAGKRDPSVRDMERSKKSYEAKLKKLGDSKKDVDNISFEQTGIDALFVDEAHNFKNLFYTTKMQGVADLGDKEGSQRAFDLYMKVRYLQKLNGGRGIVFATATPVMNSVVELYTMQRYLQGDLLDAKGLTNFDAWANQFGDVVTIRKMKTGGNGYELKQSLSKYKNLAEMQQMFRGFADVITDAADLPYLKIPKMKGGKRIVVECEPSDFQEQFMQELGERAEALRGAGKGGSEDHIFKVFNDGKKISYTQRMIDSSLPYEDGGKIMQCAENVLRIWKDSKSTKGTQLIFCDQGTPGGAEAARGVAIYEDIKNLLVGSGVPAKEIAFIHDANTEDAKAALFKAVKAGDIRVLIGSTSKMGTGMNVQDRIVALHELNAPDRPGDLEQNEGRALRQGNMNDEVEVYAYVTKKTFDSRQWDNLKRKATFIHQIMAGEYNGREAAGDGDLALSAAEISAIASDNPLIMEQFEISEKIANLENLERAHTKEVSEAKRKIAQAEKDIESATESLKRLKADLAARQDTAGDKFRITLNGKSYTERKAAGEVLISLAKKNLNASAETETYTEIGRFAGFKLLVSSKGYVLLQGQGRYRGTVNMQSAVGTIQTLEAIPRRLEGMITAAETSLSENEAAIKNLSQTIRSKFSRADELIQARVREAEILAELNPPTEQAVSAAEDGDDIDHDISADEAAEERWSAKRVGDPNKAPKRLSEIVEDIRHDFGINITTGHIRGKGVRGTYDPNSHGIRTKIANTLPTIAHELGHHLDTIYAITSNEELSDAVKAELENGLSEETKAAYRKNKWLREGMAEFLRKYLQNRETAAIDYPEFTKHFMNTLSGKDAALIQQLADEVNAYYSLDVDTATSSIRLREEGNPDARTVGEKIKARMSAVYQSWVDSLHGIKEFDKATGANTYKLASNAAYSDAIAGQIIVGNLTDANGRYVGPGLKAALTGINMNDKDEYRLFGEYLLVRHGPERLAEGMRIFADDRKNSSAFMERRQAELEAQYPQFEEAADRLYDFQQQFLEAWGVETGLVSAATAKEWAERWNYYVPLNRAVSTDKRIIGAKRGFANQNSTIKKARGSGLDVVHPVDNIVNNMVKMVNAGVRNNVMRKITVSAQQLGADATFMEKVPTPLVRRGFDMTGVKTQLTDWFEDSALTTSDKERAAGIVNNLDDILYQYGRGKAHGDVITVLKNGDQEFWKINDPQLLSSVTTMSAKPMEGILDALAVVSRFMTSNITGNNVIWSMFSNFPRDIMTMFTYSKKRNPVKLFSAMGSAYVNKVKDGLGKGVDPLYQEYLAMGGGKTSAYTADRNLAKRARKNLAGKKFSANPIDWISWMSDAIEVGPRYATYKVLRQNGMTQQEAFYEAMDITINFRRGGTISREINKAVPFFNASIQSLDKFRRWITAEDVSGAGRKKAVAVRTSTYMAVSAALAAITYALNNSDEDDEKNYEQLSNYTKNSYWCIPLGDGKYFAIPKPREIATLSSFFETCMEYGIGENKRAFNEFYAYAADNFLPSIASDIAKAPANIAESGLTEGLKEMGTGILGSMGIIGVVGYLGANRDFLGRPIVSSGLQNLEPKDQYTDRTSKIAYWIGRAFNASPQEIDYAFNSILGGWWKYQKALFPVGSENVDKTLGVQNTYVKDNQYSTDLVNWLYDKADASTKAKNSDSGNIEKAITAKMDSNMTSFYSRYYALAKNASNSISSRGVRQLVLDMILEYQKAADSGALTEAQATVYAVCENAKDTKYLPSVMQSTIKDGNDKERELSAVQYVEYQTDYLRLYWEYAEENLTRGMSYKEQAAVLEAAETVAYEEATARTLRRIGAPTRSYSEKYAGVSADNVIEFMAGVDIANEDKSVKQYEVVDIITGMDVSDSEAWALYFSKYDGKAAHEAHENGISADLYMTAKIEMENIKPDYEDGEAVRGSRREKIEQYLRSITDDYREYLFLLGTEFESVKKDEDYIMYFGEN